MTTISIKENLDFDKREFNSLAEFELYILKKRQSLPLSDAHIEILEQRLKEANLAEEPGMSWDEVKGSLKKNDTDP